ncbi:MAG TPA: DUF3553 domain-containing protein [Geobacteraceae bacterium]|nr:DUF3553 domain-containing protein [Geobacteraceae bacterium]
MDVKRGNIVSHCMANEWGSGMVLEVSAHKATIQFSDGIIRKIASSHYATLQPADRASFLPPPEKVPAAKAPATPKRQKKVKKPAVVE